MRASISEYSAQQMLARAMSPAPSGHDGESDSDCNDASTLSMQKVSRRNLSPSPCISTTAATQHDYSPSRASSAVTPIKIQPVAEPFSKTRLRPSPTRPRDSKQYKSDADKMYNSIVDTICKLAEVWTASDWSTKIRKKVGTCQSVRSKIGEFRIYVKTPNVQREDLGDDMDSYLDIVASLETLFDKAKTIKKERQFGQDTMTAFRCIRDFLEHRFKNHDEPILFDKFRCRLVATLIFFAENQLSPDLPNIDFGASLGEFDLETSNIIKHIFGCLATFDLSWDGLSRCDS